MKKNPSHATLTEPPGVENVAVGRTVASGPGRVVGGETGAPDLGGEEGEALTGGSGLSVGAAVDGGLAVAGAGRSPSDGVVVSGPAPLATAVVVGCGSGEPDSSCLTTSWCSITGAGRSVTSAATFDVAVHTMAVDRIVATSHSPAATRRGAVTSSGSPSGRLGELSDP